LTINQLNIYPNPAAESVQLVLPENARIAFPARVQVADLGGRMVRTQVLAHAQEAIELNNLPEGVYTIRLGAFWRKIVKVKG
jgi:hypothetical protein